MLRDTIPSFQLPLPTALSVPLNVEIESVISFVDENIESFRNYYNSIKDSERENRITDALIHHLQLCKIEKDGGFIPFDFRKNPTQPCSGKETDIGVFVLTRGTKPLPIFEFEAKRFSESSSNEQYVYGDRGGIERFKRGHHSSHLNICGMFAYIQSRTIQEWVTKVNSWISTLITDNIDESIEWHSSENLTTLTSFCNVDKLASEHNRKHRSNIRLIHYFMDLNYRKSNNET